MYIIVYQFILYIFTIEFLCISEHSLFGIEQFDLAIWLIKKYNPILVGLDNLSAAKTLTIYPNPVKAKFTIESSVLTGNAVLSIFDSNGRKVMERLITESQTVIDASIFQTGLYFLLLENGKSIETGKIVKE